MSEDPQEDDWDWTEEKEAAWQEYCYMMQEDELYGKDFGNEYVEDWNG